MKTTPFSCLCFSVLSFVVLIDPLRAEIVHNVPPLTLLKEGDWDCLKLRWDKPEQENNDSGMPVGNGYFGGKIKGGIARECIDFNDITFWSKGPSDNQDPKRREAMLEVRRLLAAGDFKGADTAAKKMWGSGNVGEYTTMGQLYITLDHGDFATDYRRDLDLSRSLATVKYTSGGVDYVRETFASFPDQILVMRLTASVPGKLNFTASMQYPKQMEGHGASVATEGDSVLVMTEKLPTNSGWDKVKGMNAQVRLQIVNQGGKVTSSGNALRVEGADSVVLYYASATSFNGFDREPGGEGLDPAPIAKERVNKAVAKGYDQLLSSHLTDYQALFKRLWVEVNGEKPNPYVLGFQYARYEIISSSRTGQAPRNLQGLWNRGWSPTNQGAYFLNENVEKYYSLIEPANLAPTGEPLWNWITNLSVRGAKTAEIDWGFRGWLMTHYTDIWADAAIKGGQNWWAIWPTGGAWVCQNLWEHYAFSLDQGFLRKNYPVLKGQADFLLDLLVEDGKGHLSPSPSSSPENMFTLPGDPTQLGVTVGSACDLAITRQLFNNVIEATKILNVDPEFRKKLEDTNARLAAIQILPDGRISEWSLDNAIEAEPNHRHVSPLIGVWPLAVITKNGSPDLFAAAQITLEKRGRGGYHPDKGAMWARLGDGDKALKSDDSFYTGNGLVGRWNPKYAAFCELLVQSQAGEIELLPALPTTWKSGRIEGIRARGGYELSMEWAGGKLVKCRIDSPFGTTPPIRYENKLLDPATDSRISLNLMAK